MDLYTDYDMICRQIEAFGETDPWYVPFLSNVSALLYESLQDINWAGFYLKKDGRLILGPFQGRPACIHIEIGKGVCGTAVKESRIIRVRDVHEFPGHIACDAASRSEIVLPLYAAETDSDSRKKTGTITGVLDIDSPVEDRFSEADEKGLAAVAGIISSIIRF